MGDAICQRVYITVRAIGIGKLSVEPVLRDEPAAGCEVAENAPDEAGMFAARDVPVVGDLADVPQLFHCRGRRGDAADIVVARKKLQGRHVVGDAGADQAAFGRRPDETRHQVVERGVVEVAVAPVNGAQGLEGVVLDGIHHRLVERRRVGGDPEGAVVHVTTRAPGDLGHLIWMEVAEAVAVELAGGGEGHMVHVHVEAHADGVGGDDVVDFAGLIERDLGVARPGTQCAHDNGRTAALATDQFRDAVDRVGAERHDGAAPRKPRDLFLAGIGQTREARPGYEVRTRQQPLHQRAHGVGAEQHGFARPAAMEQAVGEDVAPVTVRGELDLVDGDEIDLAFDRHGFHGADVITRALRHDLLFAGDQGDGVRAARGDDAVIDLAGKQPERQADHARFVAQHAFYREMGLAGVGRPEYRRDPAAAVKGWSIHCVVSAGREPQRHCRRNLSRSGTGPDGALTKRNGSGTNTDRITDSAKFGICSLQDVVIVMISVRRLGGFSCPTGPLARCIR